MSAQPETMPYGHGRDMLTKAGLIRWARHWVTALEQMYMATPIPFREMSRASEMTDYLKRNSLVNLEDAVHILEEAYYFQRCFMVKLREAVPLLQQAAYDDKDRYDIHAAVPDPQPFRGG